MTGLGLIFFLAFAWGIPAWVAKEIAKPKNRGAWWGFWLGWLGVIVVALLPARVATVTNPPVVH